MACSGTLWIKEYNFSVIRRISFEILTVTIVNNTVFMLQGCEDLVLSILTTHVHRVNWGNECVNDLDLDDHAYIYKTIYITLHILSIIYTINFIYYK